MTEENCEKIYHNLKRVYGRKIELEEAYKSVAEIATPRLWRRFHKAFMAMKSSEERLYKEPIGLEMTRYFLQQIFIDDGAKGLRLALNALETHMKHYKKKWPYRPMIGYDEVFEYFSAKLNPENVQKIKAVSNPLQNSTIVTANSIIHKSKNLSFTIKLTLVASISYDDSKQMAHIIASLGNKRSFPCTPQEYDNISRAI